MMFFYLDETKRGETTRHIFQRRENGAIWTFPLTEDNPNTPMFLAWVAEGNEPEPWVPESEPPLA
jgi:hypothetical protein